MRQATRGLTLREIIDHVLQHSGLMDFYRTDKEGQDRIENLEELVNAAESFVTQEGFGKDAVALPIDEQRAAAGAAAVPDADTGEIMSPLAAFLTHASLEAGDNQAQAGADAVQLMTVHSAKGLEFDAVFITGIEEGLFPHEQSLSDADGVEEERRLMYVAITRARKRLYLSFSQTRMLHGQTRYNVTVSYTHLDVYKRQELAIELARLRPALPVVISSGYIADELRQQARAVGVRALLKKENTLEELPGLVQQVLAGRDDV